mmetsp:Transcript_71463/g.198372  ORF Transcript_71463/g.198372 Transcript_71463/m.198372 type:complete len:251 (-) Transcript_71463:970-1722(-)
MAVRSCDRCEDTRRIALGDGDRWRLANWQHWRGERMTFPSIAGALRIAGTTRDLATAYDDEEPIFVPCGPTCVPEDRKAIERKRDRLSRRFAYGYSLRHRGAKSVGADGSDVTTSRRGPTSQQVRFEQLRPAHNSGHQYRVFMFDSPWSGVIPVRQHLGFNRGRFATAKAPISAMALACGALDTGTFVAGAARKRETTHRRHCVQHAVNVVAVIRRTWFGLMKLALEAETHTFGQPVVLAVVGRPLLPVL